MALPWTKYIGSSLHPLHFPAGGWAGASLIPVESLYLQGINRKEVFLGLVLFFFFMMFVCLFYTTSFLVCLLLRTLVCLFLLEGREGGKKKEKLFIKTETRFVTHCWVVLSTGFSDTLSSVGVS